MKTVVVLQPQFFPWIGVFEQMALADVFVHFDDVQLPLGRSFTSRVQVKTETGIRWLTAPVQRVRGQRINQAAFDESNDWRESHLRLLRASYKDAPLVSEMLRIVADLYREKTSSLSQFNIITLERLADFFGLTPAFACSSTWSSEKSSSHRLIELVLANGGDTYLTGHGARNYLDHELFEEHGVNVEYMDYQRRPYPQLHGPFDPHVSILDLVANVGAEGKRLICSKSCSWRKFLGRTMEGALG